MILRCKQLSLLIINSVKHDFKFVVEELLDSDDHTFGRLMNGEVRSDIFESLTLDEVKDLKLVFDSFDTDCSGYDFLK